MNFKETHCTHVMYDHRLDRSGGKISSPLTNIYACALIEVNICKRITRSVGATKHKAHHVKAHGLPTSILQRFVLSRSLYLSPFSVPFSLCVACFQISPRASLLRTVMRLLPLLCPLPLPHPHSLSFVPEPRRRRQHAASKKSALRRRSLLLLTLSRSIWGFFFFQRRGVGA